jgi:hypothetical protein
MKAKFTYKEFTLMAGIIVAVIIALTLWMRPVSTEPDSVSRKLIPSVIKPVSKAAVENIIFTLEKSL